MENAENRTRALRRKLRLWYQKNHRELPWRQTKDAYKIWVSEVMLQQTTVQAVIPYYKNWVRLFPDVKTLSCAPLQKILKAWQGLGYYQRAKNLHKSAQIMADKFAGQIPQDYNKLIRLPGFGTYITAAVLSVAFDKPYPVIDANVRRVLMRLTRMRREASPKNDKTLLEFLKPYFPQKKTGLFNQAMMELGALVCKVKNPLCLICPLPEFCEAFKAGKQEIIPTPKKRTYQKIEVVVGIIQENGKYLVQKRPSKGLLADLWEFPGGKRKAEETLEEALRREIREELAADIATEKLLTQVRHSYTQFRVTLSAYECRLKNKPRYKKVQHKWVTLKALRHLPFPSGSAKIVHFLEERDKSEGKNK
ncbi:MAG: A/G-specific adenine glycosylase [Candidatus Aminicenantes bacterium]|nr:MAG: A/G-specific adenine glycosylase [Candidatus Aminicenantes bacterium]